MQNNIADIDTKHGSFQFCVNDEFIGTALKEYGEFSEIELSIMSNFIEKGDFVFDVGANIGCFSVPFAKKVGSNGKVYAFEPQPFINKLLKKIQPDEIYNLAAQSHVRISFDVPQFTSMTKLVCAQIRDKSMNGYSSNQFTSNFQEFI